MIIVDLETSGLQVFSNIEQDLKALKQAASKQITRRMPQVPNTSFRKSVIGSTIKNLPEAFTDDVSLRPADMVKDVVITQGSKRYLKSYQGGKGQPLASVKKDFVSSINGIMLVFPSISVSKGIIFKPQSGDLDIKPDKRGKNLYSINLRQEAINRVMKSFEKHAQSVIEKQLSQTLLGSRKVKGIEVELAGKLGLEADSIMVSGPSFVGSNITTEVQQEVRSRMGKGRADSVLNYRTGRFVSSIQDVVVTSRDTIAYTFDKFHYGIHEKPEGSVTTIRAKNKPFLVFRDHKTNRMVKTKSVKVRSRPIIKKAIRKIALDKFRKQFKMVVR